MADEKTPAFVIEFRSGSFFVNLSAEHGGPRHLAMGFPTKETADEFANQHVWIRYNGGMVVAR
jgi:hypothetical protein